MGYNPQHQGYAANSVELGATNFASLLGGDVLAGLQSLQQPEEQVQEAANQHIAFEIAQLQAEIRALISQLTAQGRSEEAAQFSSLETASNLTQEMVGRMQAATRQLEQMVSGVTLDDKEKNRQTASALSEQGLFERMNEGLISRGESGRQDDEELAGLIGLIDNDEAREHAGELAALAREQEELAERLRLEGKLEEAREAQARANLLRQQAAEAAAGALDAEGKTGAAVGAQRIGDRSRDRYEDTREEVKDNEYQLKRNAMPNASEQEIREMVEERSRQFDQMRREEANRIVAGLHGEAMAQNEEVVAAVMDSQSHNSESRGAINVEDIRATVDSNIDVTQSILGGEDVQDISSPVVGVTGAASNAGIDAEPTEITGGDEVGQIESQNIQVAQINVELGSLSF